MPPKQAVKQPSFRPVMDAKDNIGFVALHNFQKIAEKFRCLFEVGIEKKNQIATDMRQPGQYRCVMTEIPRKLDDSYARLALACCASAFASEASGEPSSARISSKSDVISSAEAKHLL